MLGQAGTTSAEDACPWPGSRDGAGTATSDAVKVLAMESLTVEPAFVNIL